MTTSTMGRRLRALGAPLVVVVGLSVSLAACGSNSKSGGEHGAATTTGKPDASAATDTASAAKCGLGNGKKATGTPIKIGALVTKQPGLDGFTDATDMAGAYFKCVNDNGGINGRPIKYITYKDQTDPQIAKSLGTKLVQQDKVDAIVGGMSVLDCPVNGKLYQQAGYNMIAVGITNDCFQTPNVAPVNIGAGGSSVAAAQYLAGQGVKKIAIYTSNAPGADLINQGVVAFGKSKGIDVSSNLEDIPINDANGLALKMVQAAGDGGGVVVNFNPPDTLKVLQAVQQQGLQDRVKWACPSGCNDSSLIKSLGSAWDGKIAVNAEFSLPSATGSDATLFRKLDQQYTPSTPLSAYGQMGFLSARVAVQAMLGIKGAVDPKTINAAIAKVKDYKSDMLCKPWYFGAGQDFHLANNATRMVAIKNGALVPAGGCFDIAATPTNHLDAIRQYEQSL
jgi:branched-chain amino acid transport system substrate-binding protein